MGQRLVLTIADEKGSLAKAYYHWSGYTSFGLELVKQVVNGYASLTADAAMNMIHMVVFEPGANLDDVKRILDSPDDISSNRDTSILTACKLLFSTNAGLKCTDENKEVNAFLEKFPYSNYCVGRNSNDGLVAITKEGMADLQNLAEAEAIINIESQTINIRNLFWESSEDEVAGKKVSEISFNPESIPFDEYQTIANTLIELISNDVCSFKCGEQYIDVIE